LLGDFIVDAYNSFVLFVGLNWKKPRYQGERSYPFIPTEAEIDALIASCGKKTACFLQMLKETAMRTSEALSLEWVDFDEEHKTINLKNPGKGSNPRIFHVSQKLLAMLSNLPKNNVKIFGSVSPKSIRVTFWKKEKTSC